MTTQSQTGGMATTDPEPAHIADPELSKKDIPYAYHKRCPDCDKRMVRKMSLTQAICDNCGSMHARTAAFKSEPLSVADDEMPTLDEYEELKRKWESGKTHQYKAKSYMSKALVLFGILTLLPIPPVGIVSIILGIVLHPTETPAAAKGD